MWTGPVEQVQIDAVQRESLATAIARRGDAGAAGVVRINLADDEQLLARDGAGAQRFGKRLAEDVFRSTFAVHLGGIEHAIADLEREPNGGHLVATRARRFAHMPGSESQ